jgi:hypothetical protein
MLYTTGKISLFSFVDLFIVQSSHKNFLRYLATEGQITPLFLFTLATMMSIYFYYHFIDDKLIDENGKFLLFSFQLTFFFVAGWCFYFWEDVELRKKYASSLIYVPEPWSVYSLHYKQHFNIF